MKQDEQQIENARARAWQAAGITFWARPTPEQLRALFDEAFDAGLAARSWVETCECGCEKSRHNFGDNLGLVTPCSNCPCENFQPSKIEPPTGGTE